MLSCALAHFGATEYKVSTLFHLCSDPCSHWCLPASVCLGTVLGQQVWTLPYTIFWWIDFYFSVPFFNCKKIIEELNSVLDSTCRQSQKTKWVQLNSLILTLICILVHSCTLNAICCTLLHVVLIQLGLNKPVLFVGSILAAHAKTLIIVLTDKWLINCSVWMNNFSQAQ